MNLKWTISITGVLNSSYVNVLFPTTLLKCCLNDLTTAFQSSPKCGDFGEINFHDTFLLS